MGSHDASDGDSPRLKAGFWASVRRVLLLGAAAGSHGVLIEG